jgi:NADPH:quinone reductase-like Zn-dependent oxidoreductase
MTALRALEVGGLALGKRVLITGATGGVGCIAIQLAHESGAHVTALVRNATAAQELLRRLGASAVVEHLEGDFDLIIDGVGGRTFGLAIEHVARRGVVVNIATQSHDKTVTFRAGRLDRAKGARIYTLNPLRRARLALQRDQRPHAFMHAGGQRTRRRAGRTRKVVARARPARRPT